MHPFWQHKSWTPHKQQRNTRNTQEFVYNFCLQKFVYIGNVNTGCSLSWASIRHPTWDIGSEMGKAVSISWLGLTLRAPHQHGLFWSQNALGAMMAKPSGLVFTSCHLLFLQVQGCFSLLSPWIIGYLQDPWLLLCSHKALHSQLCFTVPSAFFAIFRHFWRQF